MLRLSPYEGRVPLMFARLTIPKRSRGPALQSVSPVAEPEPTLDTIEIALPCAVVPRFAAALDAAVRYGAALPDQDSLPDALDVPAEAARDLGPVSPARLQSLLATAIDHYGGAGRATVTRSPAGLYSPEYWRIAVADASRTTVEIVSLASRGATNLV